MSLAMVSRAETSLSLKTWFKQPSLQQRPMPRVYIILGAADTRQTPVKEIIKGLQEYGVEIFGYDPLLDDIEDEFGIRAVSNLEEIKVDGVILAVAHKAFQEMTVDKLKGIMNDKPILIDVRGLFNQEQATRHGFYYRCL